MSTPVRELRLQAPGELIAQGRQQLAAWEQAQPENFFTSDQHLRGILEFYWDAEKLRAHEPRLTKFGGEAATLVDAAVRRANETHNLPRLERFNAVGARIEEVIHCADHHLAGKYIYGSGAMAVYAEPGNNVLAQALFYLSSYNGEAGHNCPLACTAGVIKILQYAASAELKAKYLPRLLDENYETRYHGAQFLTEVQGGSDVGANACVATPSADGTWRINGEKWFCSNVTADLALITARPEGGPAGSVVGTKGLGLFLVPRRLDDGALNGMYIRRLKDKLGTKTLATAEVDFKDAVAYPIGEPGKGFQHAMDYVINTSRLYNAVGSAAAARRAYVVAWTYAQHRQAFGQPIAAFPLVQETLAEMRCDVMALTVGSFYLAHLRDKIELGEADETDKQFFRFMISLNKYYASVTATQVVRRAIEILGGNGAMENFSVLPRLLRDCVIFEAWEGAHNTLLAQAVRDVQRHRLHEAVSNRLAELFDQLPDDAWREAGKPRLAELREQMGQLNQFDEPSAGVILKPLAEAQIRLFYLACLMREASSSDLARAVVMRLQLADDPASQLRLNAVISARI
ncbi:MAG: acyl-CoA dehydrogenase family protein [Acidobacteria bacterium]|nr:acyl-CoA dehydrogenase family protein [Acidobacteriota bacterium]MBI3422278.1 acyl-CoA dehydrogenase family protein [Acidobacteriota bacterium]